MPACRTAGTHRRRMPNASACAPYNVPVPTRPRLLPVVALVVILISSWTRVGAQDDPDGWKKPTAPVRIVGPIHYVGTYGLAAYLIATPEGHILIDGAVPEAGPDIVRAIEAAGFKPRDVRILLNTQAHYDHVGTLAHLKQVTGGRIVVMKGDEGLLATGGAADYLFGARTEFHFPAVKADQVVTDGHVVTLGGVSLTARATPGHTPGTTTWTMTVQEGGLSYRVAFAGSTFVNPGTRLVKHPSYRGIEADYRRSFALLESLPVDMYLAAHAQAFDFPAKRERAKTEGPRAFVDPDALRKAVITSRAAFEKLVAAER
jgi:metallo-beta-lactamase class B